MFKVVLRRIIGTMLAVVLICLLSGAAVCMAAETEEPLILGDNGVTWSYSNGVLTISGSGAMDDYNAPIDAPWYSKRDYIKIVVIKEGVTSIGDNAFYWYPNLCNVYLSSTVNKVGLDAFKNCDSLKNICFWCSGKLTIGKGSFAEINGPINISFPSSVTMVTQTSPDNRSFLNTKNINAYSPDGYNSTRRTQIENAGGQVNSSKVGMHGFIGTDPAKNTYFHYESSKLTIATRNISDGAASRADIQNLTTYPWESYKDSITELEATGLTSINNYAFKSCPNLKKVTLDYSGTVPDAAFSGSNSITSLTLNGSGPIGTTFKTKENLETLTVSTTGNMGEYAFSQCKGLNKAIIKNVGNIGKRAFLGLSGLTNLTITKAGIIDQYAFSGCGMETVTLGDVTTVNTYAFNNCDSLTKFNTGGAKELKAYFIDASDNLADFTLGAGCTNLGTPITTIPGSIRSLSVAAGNTVYAGTSNKNYIFRNSDKMLCMVALKEGETEFVIPNTVEDTTRAFAFLSGLKKVTIPSSVKNLGTMTFYSCTGLTDVVLPESVETIEKNALYGCSGLKTITIPKSLKSVGDNAFYNCRNLTNIYYTGSEYEWDKYLSPNISSTGNSYFSKDKVTFSYHEGDFGTSDRLHWKVENKVLTITRNSGSDTAIPDFDNSSAVPWKNHAATITKVNADFITSVGDYAFSGLKQLTADNLNLGTLTSVGKHSFEGCIKLSSFDKFKSLVSIGDYAFSGCKGFTSVSISGEGGSVGQYAFNDCTALSEVIINGAGVTIGSNAFYGCTGLESFDSGTAASLGSECFNGCTNLESINIGESCAEIIMPLSDSVESIKTLTVDPLNVVYASDDTSYIKSGTTLVMGIKKADIPDGITAVGRYAFYNQSNIEIVTIPNSVTEIEENAFAGCDGINTVNYIGAETDAAYNTLRSNIGDGNTTLTDPKVTWKFSKLADDILISEGNKLHWEITGSTLTLTVTEGTVTAVPNFDNPGAVPWSVNASRIETVVLPDDITSIGDFAFYGFSKLTNTKLTARNVTEVGAHAFEDCDALTDVVNAATLTAIGDYAFADCDGLSVVTPLSAAKIIGDNAFAECGELSNVTLSVATDIGDKAFAECGALTTISFPRAENIGDYAFEDCKGLASISFPGTTQSVGEGVLKGCSSLGSIVVTYSEKYKGNAANEILIETDGSSYSVKAVIPGIKNLDLSGTGITELGAHAFSGCENLESITIPDTVKTVSNNAFEGCTSLTSVNIPASVENIGSALFSGCSSLETITVDAGNKNYKSEGNAIIDTTTDTLVLVAGCKGTAAVPDTVKIIGEGAFEGCTELKAITIPEILTEIKPFAFYGCTGLEEMKLPDTVVRIGESAFEGCLSLSGDINIKSLTEISDKTFKGCASLETVEIPEGVTSVGEEAFMGCYALESTAGLRTVKSIGNSAFESCASITKAELPDAPDESGLGTALFKDCTNLKIVSFTKGIKTIPDACFKGCSSLMNVRFYQGMKTIGKNAFDGSTELETVQIPVGVTLIDENAFNGTGGEDGKIDVVNYTGSENSWKTIDIKGGNDPLVSSAGIVFDFEDIIFPENLIVSPDDSTVSVGDTVQLTVEFYPDETTRKFKDVAWSSSDESKAVVSNTGLVTTKGVGEVYITIKTTSDEIEPMEAVAKITVLPPKYTVTYKSGFEGVSDKSESVFEGDKISLDPYKFYRDGYYISGWKDDAGKAYESGQKDIVITGNITFTAQWEKEEEQPEEENEKEDEKDKEKKDEKPASVSPNQVVVKKVKIKDSEGNELEIDMNVEISKAVSYNGCKHVPEGGKSGGSTVADLTVKVTGGIEKYATVKSIKVKNNKNASASASKKPQIIITLKATGADKAVKKSISSINKELKKDTDMTFEILPLDLSWAKGNLTAKANGKKTKVSKLSYTNPSGKTVKLTKKDFSVDSIDPEKGTATITGKGNCSNTVVLPLS